MRLEQNRQNEEEGGLGVEQGTIVGQEERSRAWNGSVIGQDEK